MIMDNNEVDSPENVAKRLKWLRKYHGLTQVAFAESIGMTNTRYSNWETGEQRLTLEGAISIIKLYGTSLDFLFLSRVSELPSEMLESFTSK